MVMLWMLNGTRPGSKSTLLSFGGLTWQGHIMRIKWDGWSMLIIHFPVTNGRMDYLEYSGCSVFLHFFDKPKFISLEWCVLPAAPTFNRRMHSHKVSQFLPVCAGWRSVQEADILNNHKVLWASEFAIHLLTEIKLIYFDLRSRNWRLLRVW